MAQNFQPLNHPHSLSGRMPEIKNAAENSIAGSSLSKLPGYFTILMAIRTCLVSNKKIKSEQVFVNIMPILNKAQKIIGTKINSNALSFSKGELLEKFGRHERIMDSSDLDDHISALLTVSGVIGKRVVFKTCTSRDCNKLNLVRSKEGLGTKIKEDSNSRIISPCKRPNHKLNEGQIEIYGVNYKQDYLLKYLNQHFVDLSTFANQPKVTIYPSSNSGAPLVLAGLIPQISTSVLKKASHSGNNANFRVVKMGNRAIAHLELAPIYFEQNGLIFGKGSPESLKNYWGIKNNEIILIVEFKSEQKIKVNPLGTIENFVELKDKAKEEWMKIKRKVTR